MVGLRDIGRGSVICHPAKPLLIRLFRWVLRVLLPHLRAAGTRDAVTSPPSSFRREWLVVDKNVEAGPPVGDPLSRRRRMAEMLRLGVLPPLRCAATRGLQLHVAAWRRAP